MKQLTRLLAALAFAAGCAAMPAAADDRHDDRHDDFDWRAMSAEWWQWALSIPAATNPLGDSTGAYCMVGQRGPTWFLAGRDKPGMPTQRTCTVPANSPLFFPVINSVWVNTPGGSECDNEPVYTVAELRAKVAPAIDGATGISVMLNNRQVKDVRRVKSKAFAAVFPANGPWDPDGKSPCLVPGKLYYPSVDDGYYVRLRGLPEGQHHLSFRGTSGGGFTIDMFYTLNAVKVGGR